MELEIEGKNPSKYLDLFRLMELWQGCVRPHSNAWAETLHLLENPEVGNLYTCETDTNRFFAILEQFTKFYFGKLVGYSPSGSPYGYSPELWNS